jgi:hypothetical protein
MSDILENLRKALDNCASINKVNAETGFVEGMTTSGVSLICV